MKVHCQGTKITNIAKTKIAKKAYIGDVEVLIEGTKLGSYSCCAKTINNSTYH